jgi:hypothetical protein
LSLTRARNCYNRFNEFATYGRYGSTRVVRLYCTNEAVENHQRHGPIRCLRPSALPQTALALRALFFVALLLDLLTLVFLPVAPDVVAKIACALRPASYVAWPFFSQEWFDYASTQCLTYPTAACVALIFFNGQNRARDFRIGDFGRRSFVGLFER